MITNPHSHYQVLLRMLNQCIKEPHIHMAVLLMQPNGEARLDFIQVSGGDRREEEEEGAVLCSCSPMGGRGSTSSR